MRWRTATAVVLLVTAAYTPAAAAQSNTPPDLVFPGSSQLLIDTNILAGTDPAYGRDRSPGWINRTDMMGNKHDSRWFSMPVDFDIYRLQELLNDLIQDLVDQSGTPGFTLHQTPELIEMGQDFDGAWISKFTAHTKDNAKVWPEAVAQRFHGELVSYLRSIGAEVTESAQDDGRWRGKKGETVLRPLPQLDIRLSWHFSYSSTKQLTLQKGEYYEPGGGFGFNIDPGTVWPDYSAPIGSQPRNILHSAWSAP